MPAMTTMHDALRVVHLGAGRMGMTHLSNVASIPGVDIISVTDPDPEAAERGRSIAGAPRAFSDPAEAIDDPDADVRRAKLRTDLAATGQFLALCG